MWNVLPFPLRSETKLIIIVYLSQVKNRTLLLGLEWGEFQNELGCLDVLFPWVALQASAPASWFILLLQQRILPKHWKQLPPASCHLGGTVQKKLWWGSKRSCHLLWFALLLNLVVTIAISDGEINHMDQRQPQSRRTVQTGRNLGRSYEATSESRASD